MASMNFQLPSRAVAVTPSDTVNLPYTSGLYIGGAGNVTVEMEGGDLVTFNAVPVGAIIMMRIVKVMSTGTTATLITRFGEGTGAGIYFLMDANGNFVTQVTGELIIVPETGVYN